MKITLALLAVACTALGGCVAVPVEPGPVYAAPPPPVAVQKALEAASRATAAERRLRVRIGVHLGDVIEKADGTIYGHGVNVAARLQAKAAPGGLCMSETLYESVKDRLAGAARFAGRQ